MSQNIKTITAPTIPHSNLRIPESVLVIVYNDNAQVLLLKRRQPFEFWQSVTGSLEPGESVREAALRELREETGFTSAGKLEKMDTIREFEIDRRWRHRYAANVTTNKEHEWRYRLPQAVPASLCEVEHSTSRWFSLSDAIDVVWSWTNRDALKKLRADLK